MGSARLRSLWDIMLDFHGGPILAAISKLTATEQIMNLHPQGPLPFAIAMEDYEHMVRQINIIHDEARRMKLKLVAISAKKLLDAFVNTSTVAKWKTPSGIEDARQWTWINCSHIVHYSQECRERLSEELSGTMCFVLAGADHDFYAPSEPLFGDAVDKAFPSAAEDILEAGRCRAVGRWTACVLHLMRALEPALLAFQDSVKVNVPKVNWQDILNQINAKIKENGHKDPDHAWDSEASLQFLRFKDAWRNYAVHGRDFYGEERASEIYDSVRAFMRHLSTRLSE